MDEVAEEIRFLTRGEETEHRAGDLIFAQGDAVGEGGVFHLVSGRVRLERLRDDGSPLVDFDVEAGDFFGACSTYGSPTRVFRARALEDCRLYRWTRKDFDFILGVYQEAARAVIQSMSRRLRAANHLGGA